ncbi:hypothetical protein [Parasphingorhabdus sp.]|uniref:hypothetical protein n=1 Tax=Parasphingorhabdus sp. TaxID=2709688 RepID=UPI003A90410C
MKLPFIERIWHIKGSLALEDRQSPEDAFEKLDPLFQTHGTVYEIEGDTLTFRKHNPAAQDKLATFNRGTLRIVESEGRPVLAYNLTSPALLACFLAPLLFLALAQATIAIGEFENSKIEAAGESGEGADKSKKNDEADKDFQLHWLDEALGAPAPEKPDEKDKDEDKDKDKKHSPTAAYILAAIFATLYIVGRILEPWLIKSTFRKKL